MTREDRVRPEDLKPGVVVHVDREASVQFIVRPILFRIIRVGTARPDQDWVWMSGYQLNAAGDATERRDIYVQRSGLRPAVNRAKTPAGRTGSGPGSGP